MQEKTQFVHSNEDCFKNAPGLYFSKDINSVYTACNDTFSRLVGMQLPEEVIGKTDYELSCREQANMFRENDQEVITSGHEKIYEEFVILANGERVTYLVSKRPVFDDTHTVVGLSGFCIDITKYKNETRNTQLNLEQVVACMPGSVYWKNRDGVYLGCNDELADLFGLPRSEVPGKTDYDFAQKLGWSDEVVEAFVTKDREIIASGEARLGFEEPPFKFANGKVIHQLDNKMPLRDISGHVVGVVGIGIDITERKQAEEKAKREARKIRKLLKLENERQQIALQEKEKFANLARKVAHDINSPLAALKIMSDRCDELPENKRSLLKRATENIVDIANNLINSYQFDESSNITTIEERQPLLVSDQFIQLLSEKKVQYQERPVSFETAIADDAYYAFILMQKTEFRRSMSNLINNAVDALENKDGSVVTVQLTTNADSVVVKIQDNGKGMPRDKVEKMLAHQGFTDGKKDGHGLGLQQVWDTLEHNKGTMAVHSELGKGTSIQLTFPRIATSKWIAQEIHLIPDNTIVILDDDDSIHTAWNLRFTPFLASHPTLQIHHFTQGQEVLDFLATLNQEQRNRVIFLSDYELLKQNRNGLQVVEASEVKGAMLVTSYYSSPKIQEEADRLKIKILPKQMASVIPIQVK